MTVVNLKIAESVAEGIFTGRVLNKVGEGFRIVTVAHDFVDARLAASCLVAPQKGSEVLLVEVGGQVYILAVLTHPAETLRFEAKTIEWVAQNAYQHFGQLWQKTDSTYLEAERYRLETKSLTEKTAGLRFAEAEVMTDKAGVVSIQADKFLVN